MDYWTKFLEQLGVIGRAPIPHLIAFAITVSVTIYVSRDWISHYEELTERAEDSLARYKQLVERTDPPNRTAYTEMSNADLKAFSKRLYEGIRLMHQHYATRRLDTQVQLKNGTITQQKHDEDMERLTLKMGQEFESKYLVDQGAVRRELRNRLPEKLSSNVVGFGGLKSGDSRERPTPLEQFMPAEFSVFASESMAREIEELSKLLPG